MSLEGYCEANIFFRGEEIREWFPRPFQEWGILRPFMSAGSALCRPVFFQRPICGTSMFVSSPSDFMASAIR